MTSPFELKDQRVSAETSASERTDVSRLVFAHIEDFADGVQEHPTDDPKGATLDVVEAFEANVRAQTERIAAQLAETHAEALAQARLEYEEQLELRIVQERAMLARVCERFTQERTRYFAAVEEQVVRLSLAIAARVLHREAKMDPLLLMGAARVALEKIHDDSETVLRVSGDDLSMWMNQFADGTTSRSFRIVPDDRIERGDCVLETSVGTVELGVEVQLAEIERGFFDLLQKRPA